MTATVSPLLTTLDIRVVSLNVMLYDFLGKARLVLSKYSVKYWRLILFVFAGTAFAALLFAFVIESMSHIIFFNGYAANGAFQLMNPLTRLADGQALGRDFPFFHGAGVALIHLPLFLLFGQGLFGSEMSRWFTSLGLFVIVTATFVYLWFRASSIKRPLLPAAVTFLAVFCITAPVADVITPSNSLLGVRTTMPIIIGMLILFRQKLEAAKLGAKPIRVDLFSVCIGAALAIAVLFGTEHGLAAILAYSIVEFVIRLRQAYKNKLLRKPRAFILKYIPLARHIGLTAIFLILFSTIISLGHPLELLRYALVTVPGDQFWYFGAEPQGFLKWSALGAQLSDPSLYPLYIGTVVSIVILYLTKKMRILSEHQWIAIAFILLYGVTTLSSLLGYFFPSAQIQGTLRAFILVDVLIAATILYKLNQNRSGRYTVPLCFAALVLMIFVVVTSIQKVEKYQIYQTVRFTYHNIRGDHTSLLSDTYKQRLDSFQPFIGQAARQDKHPPLWSTYASLYERENNIIQPSKEGCDYIIHCLGDMRDDYSKDFATQKPELAITLRPKYFGFEEWLWGRHADFYETLVDSYDIVAENDAHILWKRKAETLRADTTPRQLKPANGVIDLPSTSEAGSQVIEVTAQYQTDPLYSKLPMFNKLPRYMVRPVGTTSTIGFSLPPDKSEWKFLVVLSSADTIKQQLVYGADGLLPRADLTITDASYRALPVSESQRLYFTEKFVDANGH